GVLSIREVVDIIRPGPVRVEGRKTRAAPRLELERIVARLAIRAELGDADHLWVRPSGVGECRRRRPRLVDVQGIIQPSAARADVGGSQADLVNLFLDAQIELMDRPVIRLERESKY